MRRRVLTIAIALAALVGLATPAGANGDTSSTDQGDVTVYHAWLAPVPHASNVDGGSQTGGKAIVLKTPEQVIVLLFVKDAAPNLPHAQHIHGVGLDQCPGPEADADGDGFVSTAEGIPAYGSIQQSLTTTGDAGPESGLAVDRFPVAMMDGWYIYARSFEIGVDIPQVVADNLDLKHIVVHGIDANHNGEYDFSSGPSSLDPSLPLEATVPAACGELEQFNWQWWVS